jgi:DNA-binding response OmpR family regulator
MRILCVEDNIKLASNIKKGLEQDSYAVDTLHDGEIALLRIQGNSTFYDLVVLDSMLPTVSGPEILKTIRKNGITIPVLMLTALDDVENKVSALDAGADDYLAKPFEFAELKARIRALLRRPKDIVPSVISLSDITLDTNKREVKKLNKIIALTAKEFSILEYMMRNPGQVLTREQIMNHVWDYSFDSFSNVVDVHIKNLRKKLQKKNETIFETIHGLGYRFNA